jgi:hypothetical protein
VSTIPHITARDVDRVDARTLARPSLYGRRLSVRCVDATRAARRDRVAARARRRDRDARSRPRIANDSFGVARFAARARAKGARARAMDARSSRATASGASGDDATRAGRENGTMEGSRGARARETTRRAGSARISDETREG